MRVLDPSHLYDLQVIDQPNDRLGIICRLQFVKRQGEGYPGNTGSYPGTLLQDVIRACIDRLKYVDKQIHHNSNWVCINLLRMVIFLLESRAAERHGRTMPPIPYEIESLQTLSNGHLETWQ